MSFCLKIKILSIKKLKCDVKTKFFELGIVDC